MKKAKQFLSLMLVVVMVLGMMVFVPGTASAKNVDDYPDADSIEYKEAVDVLSALGVLTGDESGAFNPKSNITREQAAKIITYILIGTTSADRLAPRASSFTDVETSRWSNPYIEYCVEKGIIKGYGDGRFGPADPVTATQMAKMLLMCVGYGAVGEYNNPDNWELNTIVDGQRYDILTLDQDYTQVASREQVAQYTFNALINPDLVTYSELAKQYLNAGSNIFNTTDATNLGYETFKLFAQGDSDDFGRGLHYWCVDVRTNDITGMYDSDNLLNSFVVGAMNATQDVLFTSYKWNKDNTTLVDVWVNGAHTQLPVSFFAVRGGNSSALPAGAFVEIIDDGYDGNHDNEVDKIIITYEILSQVMSVVPFNGTITLQGYDIGDPDVSKLYPSAVSIFATGFETDEYVLVKPKNAAVVINPAAPPMAPIPTIALTPIYTTAPLEILPTEQLEDTLVAYTSTPTMPSVYPTLTFGSKTYNVSAGIGLGSAAPLFGDSTAAYFLDSHGQVVGFVAQSSAAATLNYVYISNALVQPINSLTGNSVKVAAVHVDGKMEVFNLATNASGTVAYGPGYNIDLYSKAACDAATADIGGWYSYTINSNGAIRLTGLITTAGDRGYAQALGTGDYLMTDDPGVASIDVNGTLRRATSTTTLSVVKNGARKTYTGFASFPEFKKDDFTVGGGTQILVVYGKGTGIGGTIAAIYALNGGTSVQTYGVVLALNRTVADGFEYSVLVGDETRNIISKWEPFGEGTAAIASGVMVVVDDDNDITSAPAANTVGAGNIIGGVPVMAVDPNYIAVDLDNDGKLEYYYYDEECISADTTLGIMGAMFTVPGFIPSATTFRDNDITASFVFEDNTIYAISFGVAAKVVA